VGISVASESAEASAKHPANASHGWLEDHGPTMQGCPSGMMVGQVLVVLPIVTGHEAPKKGNGPKPEGAGGPRHRV